MGCLFIFLGSDLSHQKFFPLINELPEQRCVFFSDYDHLVKAVSHLKPDAILIHEPDYFLLLEGVASSPVFDVSVPIILVGGQTDAFPAVETNIFILPEDFTQTQLLKTLRNDILQKSAPIYPQKVLDLVVQHMPIAMFWKDKDSNYLGCDQIFCEDRGLNDPTEVYGLSDYDLFPVEVAANNRNIDKEIMLSGESRINYTEEVENANGTKDYLQKSKIPIKDSSGEVIAILGLYERITEKVKVQEHLKSEQQYLQMLMDNIPDTIYFKNNKSTFIRINQSQAQLLGIDAPSEAIGKSDFDFFDMEHARQAFLDEQDLMRNGIPLINKLEHINTKDGYKYVMTSKIPLKDSDGRSIGMVGISRDVTAEQVVKQQLRHEQEVLDALMDNIPDRIFFKDLHSKFTRVNKAHYLSYGVKNSQEIVGKTDFDLYPKDLAQVFYESEKVIFRTGIPQINHVEKKKKPDGSFSWSSVTKVPIRDERGEIIGLVGISRDVTMQELVKQEYKLAKEKAEDANRAKSLFLANMSHEIRTPMNGVIGMADILKRTGLDSVQKDYLDIIIKSGQTLLSIINDILDFSKIESGKLDLEYAPVNIRTIVEEVADVQMIQAGEKSLDFITYVDPEIPEYVSGDYVRLKQVITNLANNAVKFTAKGEVCVSVELIDKTDDGCQLLFKVKDSGIGIPKAFQDKLFQSFTQADSSTTRKFGGTGLGLAICQRLVGVMGGNIKLDSAEGEGAEFSFSLNLKVTEGKTETLKFRSMSFENLRALIVDDNKTNRQIFREYLENWKVQVYEASGGDDALMKIAELFRDGVSLDFALLDLQMAGMDGIELAAKIRQNFKANDMRLILASSVTDALTRNNLSKSGFDFYLNKPVKLQQLYQVIASVMGRSNSPEIQKDEEEYLKIDLKDKRILIAEDNEINMKVAVHAIEGFCPNVSLAYDGKQAVELFRKEKFDYILMDVQMPVLNGIEATKQIREIEKQQPNGKSVRIIAMTANTLREDVEYCLKIGMNAFLGKPFRMKDLIDVLDGD